MSVTVKLTVLDAHADRAREIFEEDLGEANSMESSDGFTEFEFIEMRHDNLGIEDELQSEGIPYDRHWGYGDDFDEGNEYLRFTDTGEPVTIEVYVTGKNPPLNLLMERLGDHDKLAKFILEFHKSITPLPWDNQEEFARRYLARQLISQ